MPWIRIVDPADAEGLLRSLYEQIRTPDGHVDQILKVHSLRPRTLQAHLAIYKAVLHSRPNGLSPREREIVGVCVSGLNGCTYCVEHHRAALARHVGDADLAARLARAAAQDDGADPLTGREQALCRYARKLTRSPAAMVAEDLEPLRQAGLDDAMILDLNQIAAYFAYANRTVQGLGVATGGEPLGLHPDEDEGADGYRHR
jgi:uncharacterized peroxidase-related enzyme